mmetsp:Transcript_15228/g.38648  ORF Transcript_15228/g.38648 Transcript_15228/m.38648 type:complete len:534 (+) Transcript_15228:229-1830(+)
MVAAAPAERDEYSSGSDSEGSGGSDGSFGSRILPIVGRRLSQLPDFRADVGVKYVKVGYRLVCRNTFAFGLLVGLMAIGVQLLRMAESGEMSNLWKTAVQTRVESSMVQTIGWSVALAFGLAAYLFSRRSPVYLVDFSVLRPPEEWKMNLTELKKIARHRFGKTQGSRRTEELMDFMCNKIHKNAGVTSVGTYLPPGITDLSQEATMENSRKESEVVLFTLFEDLLRKTGLRPKDIDILIVNCSLFNPTPSMTAMIVNKFKLRSNVQSYNLSGMGCSAGVISINLAKDLLQHHKNCNAVVVSTENITQNFYLGTQKSMLIPNMLFRVGGAAILLSNKRKDFWRAKYQLLHVVRTHKGADDAAYNCVFQQEDPDGVVGVRLDKSLMAIAGEALKVNITTLGPLVLPISEQLKFFYNLVLRKCFKVKMKAYIPDFKKAFDHFCIHAGGRGVIDALQDNLKLTDKLVRPSRQALFHYGNTSSASIWYELAWSEHEGEVQYGDRIWQIAFGSGFKCNSAVWQALRPNNTPHEAWANP